MNTDHAPNKMLGTVAILIVAGCLAATFVLSFIEKKKKEARALFDQGAIQGASVILQSQGQGVTNMEVHAFLDAAWWLHTNKGGAK